MKSIILTLVFFSLGMFACQAQEPDSILAGKMKEDALREGTAYQHLVTLCREAPGRMIGWKAIGKAIQLTYQMLEELNPDTVYFQPVMGPHWEPGESPRASISSQTLGVKNIHVIPLGTSVGTGPAGLTGQVVEVKSWAALDSLGTPGVKGKIVFLNRPMEVTHPGSFAGYGKAVDQRVQGASLCAKLGAVGVLVRSVTTVIDSFPHTGVMHYQEGIPKIPAVAISTSDAELLSGWLKTDPSTTCYFRTFCETLPPAPCFNVVAELKGTEFPNEIITVGGHLDCWFIAQGAQDDGAGVVQSIEVLRLLKEMRFKPRHTLRIVLFMDEEMTQTGAKKYAEILHAKGEKPVLAMESDMGGFAPVGFGISAPDDKFMEFQPMESCFRIFGIPKFTKGAGGSDVAPLRPLGAMMANFIPESSSYFNFHHSAKDRIEIVNPTDLEMGSAAMATFIYLADRKDL